jgi:hypothetical protein
VEGAEARRGKVYSSCAHAKGQSVGAGETTGRRQNVGSVDDDLDRGLEPPQGRHVRERLGPAVEAG